MLKVGHSGTSQPRGKSRFSIDGSSSEVLSRSYGPTSDESQRIFEVCWLVPDINQKVDDLQSAGTYGVGSRKMYFGGLTILPCNVKLSVAPARALTPAQAAVAGDEVVAIHNAVRKGDVRLGSGTSALLGVKVGSRNATPLAVVRGVFEALLSTPYCG